MTTIHVPIESADLPSWSLNNLLGQYADLAQLHHEAVMADAAELDDIEADMARVADEIERRCES